MKSFTERQAEVDKRVAQELKNNQDFIGTTNQWLQKLDLALQSLKIQLGEHSADVGSKLKLQDISIENLHCKNVDHKREVNKALDEYRHQMSFCLNFIKDTVHQSDSRFDILKQCSESIVDLKEQTSKTIQEMQRLEQLISSKSLELQNRIDASALSIKKEISELPSEIPSLKKEISSKADVIDVNFKGVLLEIERIKYQAFVSCKHIEALDDKINRLKKELK